jgi:HK97 family phage portal protein
VATWIERVKDYAGFSPKNIEKKRIELGDVPHYPNHNLAQVSTAPENVQNIDTFFAGTRAIAEPIGSLDLKVVQQKEAVVTPKPKHSIQTLLNEYPNTYQTARAFWERATYFTVQRGEHFVHIFRNQLGDPVELHLVPPWLVSDYYFDQETRILWWRVDPGDGYREPYRFSGWVPSFDMIHVPILNQELRGRSVIRKYIDDFSSAIATRDYGNEFFGKNGKPSIWVETVEPTVTPEQNAEFSKNMKAQRHGNMLLPYGRKLHALSVPPNEAQFLGTKYLNVETICRILNVPPPVVQHFKDGSNYSNLETINRYYASATLQPYTAKYQTEYTWKLFTKRERELGYRIDFDYSSLLKADPKTRAEVDAKHIQNAIRTPNEARGRDGLAPKENGDRLLIQQNMAFLDELDKLLATKHGNNKPNNNGNDTSGEATDSGSEPAKASSNGSSGT